jgi:tetratricopeptide (TPR) repeat protein
MIRLVTILVAVLLGFSSTWASAQWREATSEHFVIVSRDSEQSLRETARRLEAVHWLLGQATRRADVGPRRRVRIIQVDRVHDVRRGAGAPDGSNLAGIYFGDPLGPLSLVPRDREDNILYHEYAHHFMFQYMPRQFPTWFVEGFAEVVSTASFERPGAITWGKVANDRRFELEYASWVPTARLFGDTASAGLGGHGGIATYGQYWVTAHYLLFAPARRGQLLRYIDAVNAGADPVGAADEHFPGGLAQLDAEVRSYLRARDFRYVAPAIPEGVMRDPVIRVLRPAEAELLETEMEVARTRGTEESSALADRIASIATRLSGEPVAHLLHARALYDAERYDEAIAAAERARAVDAGNVRATGLIAMARLRAEGGLDRDTYRAVRSDVEAAHAIDPREPALFSAHAMIVGATTTVRIGGGEAGSGEAGKGRGTRLVLTGEQGRAFREALERIGDDPGDARAAFEALATRFPDTALARYASRIVAWIDGGMDGDIPQMDDEGE